ncbi:MAG: MnhB domain-containing protein [uncultured Clostridium sp.]|jgi:energy-converting hydrogenase B subunit I
MKKRRDSILISCTNLVLPILLTLGLYIIIHGHLSPGGGFQGGVLIAGAIAIIYIGYGFKGVNKGIAANTFKIAEDIGALGFIILAFIGLVGSGVFFGNILKKGNPGDLFSSGSIFLMNFAVGFKVFAGISFLLLIMIANLKSKGEE